MKRRSFIGSMGAIGSASLLPGHGQADGHRALMHTLQWSLVSAMDVSLPEGDIVTPKAELVKFSTIAAG